MAIDGNGRILIGKRGQATEVAFTDRELAKMKNCVLTHSHPMGWRYPPDSLMRIGNSFSAEDISLAAFYDVAEIRAVTPLYTFSLKRPAGGWGGTAG